jgi:hypothetical protein
MLMPAPLTLAPRRLRAAVITLLLIGAAAALVLASAAPAHARGRAGPAGVPNGFVGVDIDGPLFNTAHPLDLNRQMGTMISNGVESIRAAFNWAAAQPYASWSHVPSDQRSQFVNGPAGRPISFVGTDAIVGDAAKHGITVLPTLLYAPGWDAHPNRHGYFATPKRDAPYAEFAGAMVRRYGPHGSFWSKNPQIHKVPIRMWQIWNEPNIATYWPQPFARSYVSLLRLAHNAIKQADRGAKVVLGGLTNLAWHSIGSIYRIGGARRLFDAVSVNGFSGNPANVILYLRFMRHAMDRYGDATKPMIASELSWPSARGQTYQHFAFNTTQNGQARDIAQLLPLLGVWRTRLVLSGFYYYTWMGLEFKGAPAFSFAGLVRENKKGQVKTKPALNAFRRGSLALESCRAKGPTATRCLH